MLSRVVNDLVEKLNEFKVYQGQKQFDEKFNELLSLIRERNIDELMFVEMLAGFIIDRCDNMLANTLDNKQVDIINELAMETLKLYIYSKLSQELLKEKEFIKWRASFKNVNPELVVEAASLEELVEQLRKLNIIKPSLIEEVVELIKSPIIKSKNELNKYLELIRKLLDKRKVIVLIFPLDNNPTLFFKRYYVASDDPEKVRRTVEVLIQLINRIKNTDGLVKDENIRLQLDIIEQKLRKMIGGKDLLSFSHVSSPKGNILKNMPSIYIKEARDLDKVVRKDNQMRVLLEKLLNGEEQTILFGDEGDNLIRLSRIRDNVKNRTYILVEFRNKEYARIKVGKTKETLSKLRNVLMKTLERISMSHLK